MDKGEFLSKLERLYPSRFNVKSDEVRLELIREYADTLTTSYRIDFDKLWDIIRDEYEYATTPPTSYLKKHLLKCKMVERDIDDLEDTKTVKVKFPWGLDYEYEFVVQKNQTEKDVLKRYLPKNWHWNFTLDKPEKNEV